MLKNITIRDFAIVDELSVDLDNGMTVLTGETGAGKSILLDALNLALGDRADSDNIRHNKERAEINVSFMIDSNSPAAEWLNEQELDTGDECLIRRVISREGRSKGFINGSPVPMQSLRTLGEMLVDIHGQHEHQSILRTDVQRQLLDEYAGNLDTLARLKKTYHDWRAKQTELDTLKQNSADRNSRRELLQYQVGELDKLELQESELEQLDEEQSRLANAEHLRTTAQTSLQELYESEQGSAHQSISHAVSTLETLQDLDPNLKGITETLNSAAIQLQESASDLRNYIDQVELDPERLSIVEERLGLVHDLARKHQVQPAQLVALHQELASELQTLEHAEQDLGTLAAEITTLLNDYHSLAKKLGQQRKKAGNKLNQAVTETIRTLGMPSIEFKIELSCDDNDKPSVHGHEKIEYMISPNPGQPLKALRKIASGGELSRISLAIQTVLAHTTHIPTLIYDEVDAGIGGPTAEVVGNNLRKLGENHQVLCVTHLAQVASQAHQHYKVSKSSSKQETSSSITQLQEDARVEETARMLGGIELTEQSLLHAREMIERANQPSAKKRKQA